MSESTLTPANPLDRFSVAGQSVLVTGATGALGSAASRGLAAAGANLTLSGGNTSALEELRSELTQSVDTSHITTVPIPPRARPTRPPWWTRRSARTGVSTAYSWHPA